MAPSDIRADNGNYGKFLPQELMDITLFAQQP